MNHADWDRLSDWHNSWLGADGPARERLRAQLAASRPALVPHADALAAGSHALEGFLETPALLAAARDVAAATVTLEAGERLGPYEVVDLLAHGGMGDVYRARDVRLQRAVALKMLAHPGTPDLGRIERFLQEARVTASLDHPNIVKVFDVGLHKQLPYIVAELLDGETLRARLAAGPLGVADVRRIAAEIARGLAAAHAAGLVHRDLKPENVFLTRTGAVKILDFGIAKLAQDTDPQRASSTMTGVLLGTAGYLAPEQIDGSIVDGRADLFALGSVLFEALTGQRAFARPHVVDTLHAILHDPLPALASLRADVPAALAAVVERLVEKDPAARFQSAADLVWMLERLDTGPFAQAPAAGETPSPRTVTPARWVWPAAATIAIVAFAIAIALLLRRPASTRTDAAGPLTQFTWTLPDGLALGSAAVVSPDRQRLAFVGVGTAGVRLFVRDLASLDVAAIPGTEGAKQPFWSPDSRALGFFAREKLMKVDLRGEAPIALADAADARGGTWSPGGVIVFQPLYRDSGLLRVSASGGPVERLTTLDVAAGDVGHRWPVFLPDGVHFLYHLQSMADDRQGVYVGDVTKPLAPTGRRLFASDTGVTFVAGADRNNGFVLSPLNDHIEARPLNLDTLTLAGDARRIAAAAAGSTPRAGAMISAAAGLLAFSSRPLPWGSHPSLIARDGTRLQRWPEPELSGWLRFSPDGQRLSRTIVDPRRGNPDVWVEDLSRRTMVRVTMSRDMDVSAVWSADGQRLAFRTGTVATGHLTIAAADGTGVLTTLPCPHDDCEPTDWSPDGRLLLANSGGDIWSIPTAGGEARPVLAEPFVERDARLSPDGRWIAYVSNESGSLEVSIRSLAGRARRVVVSSGGGDQPVWSRHGSELFYVGPDQRIHGVAARTAADGSLNVGAPVVLGLPPLGLRHWGTVYDVSPDGRRFVLPQAVTAAVPREVGMILNWQKLVD